MGEIDYTTIAIITVLNTSIALIVKELFDLFKDYRKRLREEILRNEKREKRNIVKKVK